LLFLCVIVIFFASCAATNRIQRVGPGFFHASDSFSISGLDIGVQQNYIQLSSGRFLILDTINLTTQLTNEINAMTNNGALIEAVLGTHPFHTLFFPAFYQQYPNAKYYGTPRHLRDVKSVKWTGSLWDCQNRVLWPEVRMRIPRGSEFVNPQPETSNHFSGIHVYHVPSGVLHVDDTIDIAFGVYAFHPSMVTVGLYHAPQAVIAFQGFVQGLISEWNFTTICVAHKATPQCKTNAKHSVQNLLKLATIVFLGLEAEFALTPNATQFAAFQAMQAHENNPMCRG